MAPTPKFPLSVVLTAVDQVTGPVKGISRKVRGLTSGMVGQVAKVAAGIVGLGVGVTAVLGGIVSQTASMGDNVAKTAQRLGLSAEALQEWRFAADRAGISAETFDMAVQRFGRRAAEAARGTGEAKAALRDLGITLIDDAGNLRDLESLLPEVADALASIESPLLRNSLAMKLFDSEGVKLVQLMDAGSKGIAEMRAEARLYGAVLSEESAAAAEKFTDAQTNMRAAMFGVKVAIGSALMPQFTKLTEATTDFFVRNRERVSEFAQTFAAKIPGLLDEARLLFRRLHSASEPFLNLVRQMSERIGPLHTAMAIFAGLIALTVVPALVAATGAAIHFTLALATNPLGILAVAASVLALMLVALVAQMKAAGLSWTEMWEVFKFITSAGVDYIARKIQRLTDLMPDWMLRGIKFANPLLGDLISRDTNTLGRGAELTRGILEQRAAREATAGQGSPTNAGEPGRAKVTLDFLNLPRGVQVRTEELGDLDLTTLLGFAGGLGG